MEDMSKRSNCKHRIILALNTSCSHRAPSHAGRVGTIKEEIHETRCVCGTELNSSVPLLYSTGNVSDGSGSIDREEFLQIPQIASNPLAQRMIAIFDEEYVCGT